LNLVFHWLLVCQADQRFQESPVHQHYQLVLLVLWVQAVLRLLQFQLGQDHPGVLKGQMLP